ncbi:MAG: hypothetical protein P4N59_33660 [Negativicutes bacterium]|nr:hypothetical protein [Negativicutes bacterium]
MGKKLTDSKTVEKLALIAIAKAGPDDNIAEVTKKVITDYFWAMETIREHNGSVPSKKKALKLLGDQRQEKKRKLKKIPKQTAGE